MAEEEIRRRREAEQMASEALIQKIQAEEQQILLAQLAQDQLLAKTMAKQQVAEKQKETKCYNNCLSASVSRYVLDAPKFKTTLVNNVEASLAESAQSAGRQISLPSSKLRQTNMVLLESETIHSDVHRSNEINAASVHKDQYCQKRMPIYNAITKKLKHHTSKFPQTCTSNYPGDPGCSTSGNYATETKEELRIPSDVVNNKKKSLGVEVCMTVADDDERIGSAESSGSHDSINQEIHHFKPIKTVPRTELKISSDGKPINPKLIRTIPILKKIPNAVPKPPSPTRAKRIIGCSWSAFKGRIKQDAKRKQAAYNSEDMELAIDQKPSTSTLDCSLIMSNKLEIKPQTNDAICRLDFMPESSFDSNKNYTKTTNKIINGTKIGKKVSDDESARKPRKSWRETRVRSNAITKLKKHRNLRSNRKESELVLITTDEEDDNQTDLNLACDKSSLQNDKQASNNVVVTENIEEQVKRKKENKTMMSKSNTSKKGKTITKKRASPEESDESSAADQILCSSSQQTDKSEANSQRTKQRKVNRTFNNKKEPEENQLPTSVNNKLAASGWRKSTRNLTKNSSQASDSKLNNTHNSKLNYDSPPESCDETELCVSENNHDADKVCSDEEVIKQQQRIERLLLQEQKDYELARRLQAQFDEMEQIATRTRRGSRRNAEVELRVIDDVTRTVYETSNTRKTAKRKSTVKQVVNTAIKRKCGRPPKRTKEETRVR
ncbi:uncharacterized protein LOC109862390 isoform X2 [Pseudomyrmex gracilis]|nr:uncharacterized protein LOC109862390 isoform X2 [Pseudomyrmex gracilis]